jgi:hypothetical protein
VHVSDWVLICTTLFLGVIALVTPAIGDLIKRRILAPKLIVSFEEKPPYCLKTYWVTPQNPNQREPVYYFRFQVRNLGKLQLRRCEALLEGMWIYDVAGKPHKLFISDSHLHWAGSRDPFLDLNPHRRVYCDIGHISSAAYQQLVESTLFIDMPGTNQSGLRFLLDQTEYPVSQPNCFVPGTYAIEISLFAENAPYQKLFFKLAWSGKWHDDEEDMFRELVVTQIKPIKDNNS